MRVIVRGMNHESSTLNPIITGEEDFIVFRGNEVVTGGMLPYFSSTGIIETLRESGCEIVPTLLARAVPNGVVSGELYARLKAEFLHRYHREHGLPLRNRIFGYAALLGRWGGLLAPASNWAIRSRAARRLNEMLLRHTQEKAARDHGGAVPPTPRFCTVVVGAVQPTPRGVDLILCLGGHPPPLVRRSTEPPGPFSRPRRTRARRPR